MNSVLKIVTAMILWGSLGVFVRNINLPSVEIAFLRAVIASIILGFAGICILKGNRSGAVRKNLHLLIVSGASIGLSWVLLFQAYRYTTITNATLSYYFAPVFVILLSPFVLNEQFSILKIISVSVSMIGLLMLLGPSGASPSQEHLKGILLGLCAAGLYAEVIFLNKFLTAISNYETTLIQLATAALVLLPFVLYRRELHFSSSIDVILILILGIFHTTFAYICYFSGMKGLSAQSTAILGYVDPISAVFFGTFLLQEPISLTQVIGGLLILSSALFMFRQHSNQKNSKNRSVIIHENPDDTQHNQQVTQKND
jgi:drug/metabolite transporter (DMT)-like permease